MAKYFYMRISTTEKRDLQSFARQEKALEKYAEENNLEFDNHSIYKDDKSGKNFTDRTEWNKLERSLHEGDTIIFKDISRFTREFENGFNKYMWLMNEKKINLVFLDNLTVSTEYIKQMLTIAENNTNRIAQKSLKDTIELLLMVELDRVEKERTTLSDRIKDGIKASEKKSGRAVGNLDKMNEDLRHDIECFIQDRSIKQIDLMAKHNISRNTLKKYVELVKEGMV